jgi:hypothetical protein
MTENKKDQIPSIRVDAALMAAINAEAESEFCTVAEVVRNRLAMIYAEGGAMAPMPKSAAALQRERKQEIENELLELKLAKERRETLTVDQIMEVVGRDYMTIRSRVLSIPMSVIGLDQRQIEDLKKTVQDCMTDLSGEQRETWDDLAGN